MYEKILVPLDGSELAEVSLPFAEELAGRLGSEVTLVHVIKSVDDPQLPMHKSYIQKIIETVKRDAKKHLEKPGGKTIKIESVILVGHPAKEILDYADKEGIGLIIMSTHGRTGIKRWALGSVADKVVRASNQPVALIRCGGACAKLREKGIINKALVSLDGSKRSEAIIPYIEELASKLKAEVVLLHLWEPDYYTITEERLARMKSSKESAEDYIGQMAAKLKQKGIVAKSDFRALDGGTEAEEILKVADEINADIVAMSTHGRSGVGRWAMGSVAEKVIQIGSTPVLLVRTPKAERERGYGATKELNEHIPLQHLH